MELADGGTLRDYLSANFQDLIWLSKLEIGLGIARGLEYLHRSNIVHRDLHDKNVLIHRGRPKISDFGRSKHLETASRNTMSTSSHGLGIIQFVDPESFRNPRTYKRGKSSDVYSLGVILWQLTSGRVPFADRNFYYRLPEDILRGVREKDVPDIQEEYVHIYKWCWQTVPAHRPRIEEVIVELEELLPVEEKRNVLARMRRMTVEQRAAAFRTYQALAEDGNVAAWHNLGTCYWYGLGTERNTRKSLELLQKAAQAGHEAAWADLGKCYFWERKRDIAMGCYRMGARLGDAHALHLLGHARDQDAAWKLVAAAANGSREAERTLALYYLEKDKFLHRDDAKVLLHLQRAGQMGDTVAQVMLGDCYLNEMLVKSVDESMAFWWYLRAAEGGDRRARKKVGEFYRDGRGTEVDLIKSREWEESAEQALEDSPETFY